jgi:hypothetical protein
LDFCDGRFRFCFIGRRNRLSGNLSWLRQSIRNSRYMAGNAHGRHDDNKK